MQAMTRPRILAVDDSPVTLTLLTAQLEADGFSVAAVDSGFAALDAARHEDFHAVILDVEMPGMDGLKVAGALRTDPKTAGVRIVMHTSLPEAEVRAGFSDFDAFLPKPCDLLTLRERLGRLGQIAEASPPLADGPPPFW